MLAYSCCYINAEVEVYMIYCRPVGSLANNLQKHTFSLPISISFKGQASAWGV